MSTRSSLLPKCSSIAKSTAMPFSSRTVSLYLMADGESAATDRPAIPQAIERIITVMQRHQRGFVAVFVMHVVNDVQRGNVLGCQPIREFVHALKDSVVVQNFVHNRLGFRTNLLFGFSSTPPLIAYNRVLPSWRVRRIHLFCRPPSG